MGTSRNGCLHPPRTPRSTQPPLAMSSRHRTKTTTSKGDDNSPGPQPRFVAHRKRCLGSEAGRIQAAARPNPLTTHSAPAPAHQLGYPPTSPGSPYVRPTHRTTTTTTRKGAILDPERNVPIPSRLLGPFSSFVARRKKMSRVRDRELLRRAYRKHTSSSALPLAPGP